MGTMTPGLWEKHIAEYAGIDFSGKKRFNVEHWKDTVEMYDLGIFVAYLSSIRERDSLVPEISIGYDISFRRTQQGVESHPLTPHSFVRFYVHGRWEVPLIAEFWDKFSIVRSDGTKAVLEEEQRQKYERRRDLVLKVAKVSL